MKLCETCDFYVPYGEYTWGYCHRYPRPLAEYGPINNSEYLKVGDLPKVHDSDFCGEHKEDFNERD